MNSNDEVILYIPKEELEAAAGKEVDTILKSLCKEQLLKTFKEVYELHVAKSQYIHIQTYLEFHGIKGISAQNKLKRKDD